MVMREVVVRSEMDWSPGAGAGMANEVWLRTETGKVLVELMKVVVVVSCVEGRLSIGDK